MTKFNEKTSNKKQKLSLMLSPETQSLQREHIFCLDRSDFEGNTSLGGKIYHHQVALVVRGFDINTLAKAEDLPQLRDINKNVKCTNLGISTLKLLSSMFFISNSTRDNSQFTFHSLLFVTS